MATIQVSNNSLGSTLQQLLEVDSIQPGSPPSYQICKTIYSFHPLGAKLVELPLKLAQSQRRDISIDTAPDMVRELFNEQWEKDNCDKHILNFCGLARIYGIASVAMIIEGEEPETPVDFKKLYRQSISFNGYDPLNTAGSLVLNQNPLAIDFMHTTDIRVNGRTFHRSRSCVIMNESPIYIEYTTSAFGFVGRSVYQRTLYPLKSFIQTMQTDDMVSLKAGLLVAMLKQAGSIADNIMNKAFGLKRNAIKSGIVGNVLSIGETEKVESLNLQNLEGPFKTARENILKNLASGAGMPSLMMLEETLAQGFGEGTEDARRIAAYIDGVREDLHPAYNYFDKICFYRAINPDSYKNIQKLHPTFENVSFEEAFYTWWNSFTATWPNLLKEPDSELVKVEDVELRADLAFYEVIRTDMDPENKAKALIWLTDRMNDRKLMGGKRRLQLDPVTLTAWLEDQREQQKMMADKAAEAPSPNRMDAIENLKSSILRLPDRSKRTRLQ